MLGAIGTLVPFHRPVSSGLCGPLLGTPCGRHEVLLQKGDIAILGEPLNNSNRAIIIQGSLAVHDDIPGYEITYLRSYMHGWTGFFYVDETRLSRAIWTFTGYRKAPAGC